MDIVVTGIGLISALGNLEATWKRLLAGQSGISIQQPFRSLAASALGSIQPFPAQLADLTQAAVMDALDDAELALPLPNCGIAIGSSRAQQAQWEQFVHDRAHLERWLETLPYAASVTTAQLIGTQAPVLSPMAACATGLWSIAQGMELIRTGQCERVLAGAIEAPITPLTLAGFARMGALAKTGAYPFDRDRQGLVLGEGGAVFVLETAQLAQQRGAKIYGQLLGFGLTADSYHVSSPDPTRSAAIAAVHHCLDRSGLLPAEVDFIHAHGTATVLNDRSEANLIQQIFPASVPVSSTKGATGHTIGASGALGVAFCLLALRDQLLPPCVGLRQPEFNLNLIRSAQPGVLKSAVCFSFGFGGQNAALAIAR